MGQGNRANSTIGRAVQLVIRNVGGGRPGEVDRAAFGSPAKVGFCFAEREADSPWPPVSSMYGFKPGTNTVLAFPGEAPRNLVDQLSQSLIPLLALMQRISFQFNIPNSFWVSTPFWP